ncbi:MAG: hypothetical protein RIG26_09920 [Thalassospira sp.]|uniref:hypothetical protein n=1 Tax=Thalassospira sp. TaxID=1912094 RepID=UPI0032EF1478
MNNLSKRSITFISVIATLIISAACVGNVKAAGQSVKFGDERVLEYVSRASAVIYVPSLTRGSLLQMRGAFGSAYFTRKAADSSWCDAAPMRILFGDFDEVSSRISSTESVVLMIMKPVIADKLAQGQDIVGDDVTLVDVDKVSTHSLEGVDIIVAGAASADSGVVLNPGRSVLNDLFGASSVDNSCGHVSAEQALTAFTTQN